jgi:2-keto-4-pentenoate hydratase
MKQMKANETITGRLFAKHAQGDGGDFEWFVRVRRSSGRWPEYELALSIKDRIPDMRVEDVLRDMQEVK